MVEPLNDFLSDFSELSLNLRPKLSNVSEHQIYARTFEISYKAICS